MVTYYIIDEQTLFVEGISAILDESGMACCGSSSDGELVLRHIQAQQPDILLLELQLSSCSGDELLTRIKRRHPQLRVLVLTSLSSQDYALQALRLGADGFYSKNDGGRGLVEAIHQVLDGRLYLPRDFAQHVFSQLADSRPVSPLEALSPQERRVFSQLGRGISIQEISSTLDIEMSSVRTYARRIRSKLGVPNLTLLRRLAYQHQGL